MPTCIQLLNSLPNAWIHYKFKIHWLVFWGALQREELENFHFKIVHIPAIQRVICRSHRALAAESIYFSASLSKLTLSICWSGSDEWVEQLHSLDLPRLPDYHKSNPANHQPILETKTANLALLSSAGIRIRSDTLQNEIVATSISTSLFLHEGKRLDFKFRPNEFTKSFYTDSLLESGRHSAIRAKGTQYKAICLEFKFGEILERSQSLARISLTRRLC